MKIVPRRLCLLVEVGPLNKSSYVNKILNILLIIIVTKMSR